MDGVATPASGDAERAFYIRALRLDSGTVSPQEVTQFFLAVHARGGQLGTFITNTAFSDEAYDEFIRCSTKYPQILVDLVMSYRIASSRTAWAWPKEPAVCSS